MSVSETYEAIITPAEGGDVDGIEVTVIRDVRGGVSGPWLTEPVPVTGRMTPEDLITAAEAVLASNGLTVIGPWRARLRGNGEWLAAPVLPGQTTATRRGHLHAIR